MKRPVWFLNMCALSNFHDPLEHLSALIFWSPFINRWLDSVHVKGDAPAEAVVRVCQRLFRRFADFSKLRDDIHNLKATQKRLDGLLV